MSDELLFGFMLAVPFMLAFYWMLTWGPKKKKPVEVHPNGNEVIVK